MEAAPVWTMVVVLAACLVWSYHLARRLARWPHTRFRHRLPLRMRAIDLPMVLAGCFLALLVGAVGANLLVGSKPGVNPAGNLRVTFFAVAIANTLMILGLPALLYLAAKVRPYQLGIHASRLISNAVFGVVQLAVWWPIAGTANVLVRSLFPVRAAHPAEDFLADRHGVGEWALFCYCLVVAAPLAEELLFRGILQAWLCKWTGPFIAIGGSALLFALAHSPTWPDPIPLVLLGVGLGITYQRTRCLWAPVALHATFNLGNVLVALLSEVS